jgi:hypothetical protein
VELGGYGEIRLVISLKYEIFGVQFRDEDFLRLEMVTAFIRRRNVKEVLKAESENLDP